MTTKTTPLFLTAALGGALACGCIADDTELDDATQELNGTWTHEGCDGYLDELEDAFAVIDSRAGGGAFLDCLKASFMTYQRFDVMAEDLQAMVRARPTHVVCKDIPYPGSAGVAWEIGTGAPEVMTIDTDLLENAPPESVARTIAHEATHSLGFNHPGNPGSMGYTWSVPEQVEACMADLAPYGFRRDQTSYGDTELAPVGGGGGYPFEMRCPAGTTVTGATTATSSHVNYLSLRCSDGSAAGSAGAYHDSTRVTSVDCDPGSSFVTFGSWSDSMVRYLYGLCAPNDQVAADDPSPDKTLKLLEGGFEGTWALRACPAGRAIVGALGRSGARIDQLRWLCDDIDGPRVANPTRGAARGTKRGTARLGMCYGNGVLHGLYGMAGAEIDRLGGECSSTQLSGNLPVLDSPSIAKHGIEPHGYWSGSPFERKCPAGTAIVGLVVHAGARIDGVAPICATLSDWASGFAATTPLPLAGSPGGVRSEIVCPLRQFVTGLETWADWTWEHNTTTVHGLELRCRDLRPPTQLEQLEPIGRR